MASRAYHFLCDSGITSSLITKSIAPAAKASHHGNIGAKVLTIHAPRNQPIGSTSQVNKAMKNADLIEYLWDTKAKATTSHSGIFCKPIPNARLIQLLTSHPPKPTPTAIHSGKLWMVIAIINSHNLFNFRFSFPSRHLIKCSWGKNLSVKSKNKPQRSIQSTTIIAALTQPHAAYNQGTIREKEVAANITQAANHIRMSCNLDEMFLVNKTGIAPIPVANHANRLKKVQICQIG